VDEVLRKGGKSIYNFAPSFLQNTGRGLCFFMSACLWLFFFFLSLDFFHLRAWNFHRQKLGLVGR
jgi:hypothetical protein